MNGDGHVRVRVFAGLRDVFGAGAMVYATHCVSDVGRLLARLCDSEAKRRALLDESGRLRKEITLLVNGRNVTFLRREATELKAGDEVHVFPPVYGG